MSIVDIESALELRLMDLGNPPEIAWEDLGFAPKTGAPYLRVHHLHNMPRDKYIDAGNAEFPGIFQVTVVYPEGRGKVEAKQMAARIAQLFAPVQVLPAGTTYQVSITQTPAIAGGMPDDGWYSVPVSISWRAFPA